MDRSHLVWPYLRSRSACGSIYGRRAVGPQTSFVAVWVFNLGISGDCNRDSPFLVDKQEAPPIRLRPNLFCDYFKFANR